MSINITPETIRMAVCSALDSPFLVDDYPESIEPLMDIIAECGYREIHLADLKPDTQEMDDYISDAKTLCFEEDDLPETIYHTIPSPGIEPISFAFINPNSNHILLINHD